MRFFSMFSGIGGFDLGLEETGHVCVGACENNPVAASIYRRHWPAVEVHHDARAVDPYFLPEFDVLVAGFPCQPFSSAGAGRGLADPRGSLFAEALRVARAGRVPYVLFENVPGLLHNDGGRTFGTMLLAMDESGYDAEWQCIDGQHYLPQVRPRVFIVGRLRGGPAGEILPVPEGGEDHARPQGAPREKAGRVGDNSVARTLVAGYWKRRSPLIEEAGGRIRMLTPNECERLQGFPDDYTKRGKDGEIISDTNRYTCLGNAVMVPVARHLGKMLLGDAA